MFNIASQKKQKAGIRERQSAKYRRIVAVLLILFCIYAAYAFYAVNPTVIDKAVGKYAMNYLFGRGTLFVLLYGVVCGVMLFMNTLKRYGKIMLLVALILLELLIIMSISIPNLENGVISDFFGTVYMGTYGGVFGMVFAFLLKTIFRSTVLVAFILIVLILVEMFFIYREIFPASFSRFKDKHYGLDWAQNVAEKAKQEKDILVKRREKRGERAEESGSTEENDGVFFSQVDAVSVDTQFLNTEDVMEQLAIEEDAKEQIGRKKGRRLSRKSVGYEKTDTIEKKIPEVEVSTGMESLDSIQVNSVSGDYHFPDTVLLNPVMKKGIDKRGEVVKNKSIIENTLKNFGVNAKVVGMDRGPSITRFELQPEPGTKVSKIVGLSDDLALALATSDIRIEAPIPGKAAVGIEVPNGESEIVSMREIVESTAFKRTKATLPIALGKTLSGQNIIGDIAKMPHLLIAGATGSGKSVCINTIILSLLYKKTPDELRFIMIDPKMVELNQYNAIPHQLIPVVTDPKKAAYALNWGIKEMTNRYELFKAAGVRDIEGYNARQEAAKEEKLPRIVIVIDELADLMMTSPKEVEAAICRIAQLARACGIHLVIATQRPSVDVITGLIKANIPSRIAFAVSSNTDSRTILDMAGAEKLLGKGDMLYFPMGKSKPLRVQCTYVADDEINRVIHAVAGEKKMTFDPQIEKVIEEFEERAANPTENDHDDALLPKAIEVAFTYNQVSTSMLQRRLKVGYARAGRLVDELEKAGIISGPNGSKPRTLLMTRQEYYDLHPEQENEEE